MDVALLFLPLIGGYVFSRRCNATKFACAREEGQRLYFRAGFYAVVLFTIAVLIRLMLLSRSQTYRETEDLLREIVKPFLATESDHEYQLPLTLVCMYAMALGPLLALSFNFVGVTWHFLVVAFEYVHILATRRGIPFPPLHIVLDSVSTSFQERALSTSPMDAMLQKSIRAEMPVAVTMDSRKVYVGYVLETPDPERETKAIRLLPLASGYRKQETLELKLTTDYDWIFKQALAPDDSQDGDTEFASDPQDDRHDSDPIHDPSDFEIVLPMNRVHSINLFDAVAFGKFQPKSTEENTDEDAAARRDSEEGALAPKKPTKKKRRKADGKL